MSQFSQRHAEDGFWHHYGLYAVSTLISKGGTGEVPHAPDTNLGREVSIKSALSRVCFQSLGDDDERGSTGYGAISSHRAPGGYGRPQLNFI